eukprot:12242257-Karenia_brevis.AAC.1
MGAPKAPHKCHHRGTALWASQWLGTHIPCGVASITGQGGPCPTPHDVPDDPGHGQVPPGRLT